MPSRSGAGKNIWCYTGYTFEKLLRNPRQAQLLKYIDVLVDGKFKKELRDEELYFRGSRNQRLIDVQTSLQKGETVIYHYNPQKGAFKKRYPVILRFAPNDGIPTSPFYKICPSFPALLQLLLKKALPILGDIPAGKNIGHRYPQRYAENKSVKP